VEVETSDWAYTKLANSTEQALLFRVKQTYDNLPADQQGGVTFFKLLVDEVDKDTFEGKQGLLKWVQSFDIRNFDGEDVRAATTTYKAVIKILGDDAPKHFIRFYLEGMAHASNKKFIKVCDTQLGFIDSVFYSSWSRDRPSKLVELDEMASTLLERYMLLDLGMEWSGANHKASAFKASLSPTQTALPAQTNNSDTTNTKSPPNPSRARFLQWWDNSTCEVKNCGGKHPTKFHDDLGARDRQVRWVSSSRRALGDERRDKHHRDKRDKNSFRPKSPRFKNDADQKKFNKKVYEAALEFVEEDDQEMFAHLAGGSDSEGGSVGDAALDLGDNDDDAQEEVHAAIGLDMLLNY
jgi:hypothetical protein